MELDCYYGYLAQANMHKTRYEENIEEYCSILKKRIKKEDDADFEVRKETPNFIGKGPLFDASWAWHNKNTQVLFVNPARAYK